MFPYAITSQLLLAVIALTEQMWLFPSSEHNNTISKIELLMNKSVEPCENFYKYACGGWNNFNPRPAGFESWEQMDLRSKNLHGELSLLLEDENKQNVSKSFKKAQIVYRDCMNNFGFHHNDTTSIKELLISVGLTPEPPTESSLNFSFLTTLAKAHALGINLLIDVKTSEFNTIQIIPKPIFDEILDDFDLFNRSIELFSPGTNVSEYFGEVVMFYLNHKLQVEVYSLSENQRFKKISRESQISNDRLFNKLEWISFLKTAFANTSLVSALENESVKVEIASKITNLEKLLNKTNSLTLERFIWWRVFAKIAQNSGVFRDLFSAPGKHQPAPQEHCSRYTNDHFGFALTNAYVKTHFNTSLISRVLEMALVIKDQIISQVSQANWMDGNASSNVIDNIDSLKFEIGYPEWIMNKEKLDKYYEKKNIVEGNFLQTNFLFKKMMTMKNIEDFLDEPNTGLWEEPPTRENAYYIKELNTVEVPVGMLAPPYFNNRLEAADFGSLGSILAHEIFHAFDLTGSRALEATTEENFQNLTYSFADQYSSFPIDELTSERINGDNSLLEIIADNAGLRAAYWAYKAKLEQNSSIAPTQTGISPEKLFFLSFAQIWCGDVSLEGFKSQLSSEHPPNKYRVNGALKNSKEFSNAWQCPADSLMNPPAKNIFL